MSTTFSFAEPVPGLPIHRFSVEEYRRLGETGILKEEHRVELLEGWIVEKSSRNPPHSVCVKLCDSVISAKLPGGWHTRVQDAITTADSEPEPDLAVVRGEIRDFEKQHPTAERIALVVEVADTSLRRDHYKRSIYARAGIPVYWIVNLRERKVEVYQQPSIDGEIAEYGQPTEYGVDQQVPLIIERIEVASIVVNELLS